MKDLSFKQINCLKTELFGLKKFIQDYASNMSEEQQLCNSQLQDAITHFNER